MKFITGFPPTGTIPGSPTGNEDGWTLPPDCICDFYVTGYTGYWKNCREYGDRYRSKKQNYEKSYDYFLKNVKFHCKLSII